MLRTAFLSGALGLTAYASAAWLTHDFQVWTAKGARRLEVALQPVAAPPVQVDGPGTTPRPLPQWLAAPPGAVTIAGFIYTRCQNVCLSLGSSFQQLQAQLLQDRSAVGGTPAGAPPAAVRLLSLSFDGAHDTPAALQAYGRQLHADASVWQFLRVPDAAERAQLLRRWEVVVVPDGRGDFEHNAALLVIDPAGRLVHVFDMAELELALNYARHLARGAAPTVATRAAVPASPPGGAP
ncbi:electron transporter SenC [Acidovorax sp. SRB_14]|uniref:SCO family protein n=1 Tax=Acidovorax sp. SRB_14 TaxID=1962699 RepID=UPI0015669DB1|nr:SCO family protein [Acidovorax sp. SRB_14]NMM80268.1 electron transporter SenC [Acidovorax sp. SRB_14]